MRRADFKNFGTSALPDNLRALNFRRLRNGLDQQIWINLTRDGARFVRPEIYHEGFSDPCLPLRLHD